VEVQGAGRDHCERRDLEVVLATTTTRLPGPLTRTQLAPETPSDVPADHLVRDPLADPAPFDGLVVAEGAFRVLQGFCDQEPKHEQEAGAEHGR
jgi:hypothetical protein